MFVLSVFARIVARIPLSFVSLFKVLFLSVCAFPRELLRWTIFLGSRALTSLPAPCCFLVFLVFDRSLGAIVEPPARPCLPLFTIHPRLMVLSNCIHQNLGFYCVARPTIFHPIVMSRLLRYFQVKLNSFPPDGIIIHMLMILHSIAWGSYLACGVLWVLGQKLFAWLAFLWLSPPSTGNMIRKFYRRIVEILFRGAIL